MKPLKYRIVIGMTLLLASTLSSAGCFYSSKETERVGQPPVVVQAPTQRAYNFPEGRYELHGDGTTGKPYYWVWIPAGVQSVPPAPPLPPIPQR